MSPLARLARCVVAVAATSIAACGTPGDGPVERIANGDVPHNLLDTTTTTTTTTTTVPQTVPMSNVTTVAPTTLPQVDTEAVVLYYIDFDHLVPIEVQEARDPGLDRVLRRLAEDPPELAGPGYSNAVNADIVADVRLVGGVAEVTLSDRIDRVPADEQLLAVGQIVLTLFERPNVGQVRFVDQTGDPFPVPLADGTTSDPDQLLTKEDYDGLLASEEEPPPTTVVTSAPATASQPTSVPASAGAPSLGTTVPPTTSAA